MYSDVNTKPKQGVAYRDMRAAIMNVERDYDDEKERTLTHPALLPKDWLLYQKKNKSDDYNE